ncbi:MULTISPECIES: response regulator transcription factor [Flavobacteriaceae]|nr:helix-turn-helix transcriptional regulator [Muricauda sp. SP22]MDC6363946.1 helix-turn-helix transcriptional regulator [Muricauda sp. SP22]
MRFIDFNMRFFVFSLLLMGSNLLFGQYHFSGKVVQAQPGQNIYLSLIEDYRKASRIYVNQIIAKTQVDSLGNFRFSGNHLPDKNRMYRIHLDNCSNDDEARHFLGQCSNSQSIVFIGHNRDTLYFPTSFDDQALCSVTSTNPKSDLLLQVNALKEEMAYNFMEYPSDANRALNEKKWFSTLQDFGQNSGEPLVELYIYDFLSDKRSETYRYYLKDLQTNPYYQGLSHRLQSTYPNTSFTEEFRTEIGLDQQLANTGASSFWQWKWILQILLILSILANMYFLATRKIKLQANVRSNLQQLTPQERNIVDYILQDMSNKEIAAELFISLSTVKTHINNLYKKLGVSSREEIVSLYKQKINRGSSPYFQPRKSV